MNAGEAIGLLAASGIDPTKSYVIGGGATVTPQDVAAAMATLSPLTNHLLRAKYAGEPAHGFWSALFVLLMDKWGQSKGMVERVCTAAAEEAVGANRCPECHGTREAKVGPKLLICSRCGGTGYMYRELHLGSPWDGRLQWCRRMLARAETEGLAQVAARLS